MTPVIESKRLLQLTYDWAADDYLRSLPLEHFMESTDQSTQRKITLESLDLVQVVRPDFQVFNELLIQYPIPGSKPSKPERVVPDNMVIIWPEPIDKLKAFHTPLQPVGPTLVMEYVSESNRRKDYEDNLRRYRDDLRVPYYLLFEPAKQSLDVFHLEDGKYVRVAPNAEGRLAIPELELEVGLIDGWVRYWHRGTLLALPGELLNQIRAKDDQLDAALEQIYEGQQRVLAAEAENARLREELAKLKGK
jgi:Uma2 family endonuclease